MKAQIAARHSRINIDETPDRQMMTNCISNINCGEPNEEKETINDIGRNPGR